MRELTALVTIFHLPRFSPLAVFLFSVCESGLFPCTFLSLQAEGNDERTARACLQTTFLLIEQERTSGPGQLGLVAKL